MIDPAELAICRRRGLKRSRLSRAGLPVRLVSDHSIFSLGSRGRCGVYPPRLPAAGREWHPFKPCDTEHP
jgi:hypothetical protein